MISSVRQVQEKCLEWNLDFPLYSSTWPRPLIKSIERPSGPYWHSTAAFRSLSRLSGSPVGMTWQILSNGDQSDLWDPQWGEARLCLAPVLFNLFFTCVLSHTVQGLDGGVYICCHFDGSIFNLCWLIAKSKTMTDLIQATLFADDCPLIAHKSSDLQTMLNRISDASMLFGLTISPWKDWCSFQLASKSRNPQPIITIYGMELKTVKSFKNLGSMISRDGQWDKKISARISKASHALGRLQTGCSHTTMCPWTQSWKLTKLFSSHHCSTAVSPGLSTAITSCNWRSSIYKHSIPSCVSQWQDKIINLKDLSRAKSTSIKVMLLKAQLYWASHVIQMGNKCIPKQLFFGELAQGKGK